MDKNNEKTERLNIIVAFVTFLVIVVSVALIGYFLFGYEPEDIQGQVDCREYRISSKVSGRIVKVMVEEGEYIHVGDTLAILEVPEMEAQQRAAQASEGAAQAMSEMADNGTREEQIRTAAELVQKAEASRTLALTTYKRMQSLYEDGVTTEQKRDEAKAAYDAAEAAVKAAQSQYEMALNGAREEEKRAAAERAKAAQSNVDMVNSLLKETVQISAVNGEVDKIYTHVGELVATGSPIMNINLLDDVWGRFNIREDRLNGIQPGSVITAYSPTFDKEYAMEVYYMKCEDKYATWKATKPDKGYDVNTFEIRARPQSVSTGLRPGMLLILKENKK